MEAVHKGTITPTPKEHKAMLTLLGNEVGKLVTSPMLKSSSLAAVLQISPTYLSNNKAHFSLMTELATHPAAIKLYDDAEAFVKDSDAGLLFYLPINAWRKDNGSPFYKCLAIAGIELYLPKDYR